MTARPEGTARPALSLHQTILSEIEDRILRGEWPPGHRIPFEQDLAAHYRCSRMTVNKVLTQLAQSGLIERRRRAGSFVRRPLSQSAVLEIKDIKNEVQALDLPYRYEVSERRRRNASAIERKRLGLTNADPVLILTCRHFAAERPFCLEERVISLLAVPEAEAEDFATLSPGAWLFARVPWTAAEHRVRATGANAAAALALSIPVGQACLVVERRTWSADHPITFVRLTYPGDAHEFVATFAPSQG